MYLAYEYLVHRLQPGELVMADDIYEDGRFFLYPSRYPLLQDVLKRVAQRHETVNHRLKTWKVLGSVFRGHDLDFHRDCFYACANLVQLCFELGEPLYPVDFGEPNVVDG